MWGGIIHEKKKKKRVWNAKLDLFVNKSRFEGKNGLYKSGSSSLSSLSGNICSYAALQVFSCFTFQEYELNCLLEIRIFPSSIPITSLLICHLLGREQLQCATSYFISENALFKAHNTEFRSRIPSSACWGK